MNLDQALEQLEAFSTEQNRKIYRRHGVSGEMYGVSYGNLNKLVKKIKQDQELALALWKTGNHDARVLATKIADPSAIDVALMEEWGATLDNYPISDALSQLVGSSPIARPLMERWTQVEDEWRGQVGWNVLAGIAMSDDTLPDDYFLPYLRQIEEGIHQQENRVRYSMNSALIAIGMRNDALEARAMEVAKSIGKVHVDHGETSCKTPNATSYIKKARARQKARA